MLIETEVSGDIEELLVLFKTSPRKTQTAISRAVRKLSRWAERQVLRDMSHRMNVSMKIFKKLNRIKVQLKNGSSGQYLSIWIGVNEVGAHHFGKAVQTARGVRVGRHRTLDSAFLMEPVNTDHDLIWRRKDNWKHKYQQSKRSGLWMWMGLPIDVETERIDQEAEETLQKLQLPLAERFTDLLYQELNYAFNVEPGKNNN